jgi:hypothetical protein
VVAMATTDADDSVVMGGGYSLTSEVPPEN